MTPILRVENLSSRTLNGRKLFVNVSMEMCSGDLILVEGENGSGKTTFIKALLGLAKHEGKISRSFSQGEVAYLPQLGNVQFYFPLTVLDVINLYRNTQAEEILQLGLLDERTLRHPWNTASGGERQRALLSRMFLARAKLLVLDEPFNHIDRVSRARVLTLLQKAIADGAGVILISHEFPEMGLAPKQRLRFGGGPL